MTKSLCHYRFGLVSGFGLAMALAAPAFAQDEPAPPPANSSQLGEIVVTAQRSKENLQKTPVAVTAFTADAIKRYNIHGIKDIQQVAPNVQFYGSTGATGGVVPYIRGGGTTSSGIITSEPEVGIYIDDVYQSRLSAQFIDMIEIDRIEVLRGPQGTLYGRNTSAGALKIVSQEPSDQMHVDATLATGSWNERYGKLYAAGPVSKDGRWRAGFSTIYDARDGGRQYDVTTKKKVGAYNFEGVQGELDYVDDKFNIRMKGSYTNYRSDGYYASSLVPGTTLTTYYKDFLPTSGSYKDVLTPTPSYALARQASGSVNATYNVADHIQFQSISAYQTLEDHWHADISGGLAYAALGIATPGYFDAFNRISLSSDRAFSQELQLRGSFLDSKFDFVTGLYYFDEHGQSAVTSSILLAPSFLGIHTAVQSYAAFGQLTYHITSKLSLTGGGRYTSDHKSLDAVLNTTPVTNKNVFNNISPKGAINWQTTRNLLLYASYSEGFKAGGYNGLATSVIGLQTPYETQTVDAYEVGMKSEWFDHRLRFNVSAFINKYSKLQQQAVTATGSFITVNYNANHKGVETELAYKVTPDLTLWSNGVHNDGHYTGVGAFSGNRMTNIFKWQATVGADYTKSVGVIKLLLGANYNYRSDYFATPDQAIYGHAPSVHLVDAYVGAEYNHWSLMLQGKNLTNVQYWTTGLGFGPVAQRLYGDPRTWRLSLSYKL